MYGKLTIQEIWSKTQSSEVKVIKLLKACQQSCDYLASSQGPGDEASDYIIPRSD